MNIVHSKWRHLRVENPMLENPERGLHVEAIHTCLFADGSPCRLLHRKVRCLQDMAFMWAFVQVASSQTCCTNFPSFECMDSYLPSTELAIAFCITIMYLSPVLCALYKCHVETGKKAIRILQHER